MGEAAAEVGSGRDLMRLADRICPRCGQHLPGPEITTDPDDAAFRIVREAVCACRVIIVSQVVR